MKKCFLTLAVFAVAAGFSSCDNKNEDKPVIPFEVVSADQAFESRGGTGTIVLSNIAGEVTATPENTWCTIDAIDGGTISFSVESMVLTSSRTTVIEVSDGKNSEELTITQDGLVFTLEETKSISGISFIGETVKFLYTRNNSILEARPDAPEAPEELPDWIKFTHEQDGLKMEFDPNEGGARSFEFALSLYNGDKLYKAKVSTVTVTQLGLLSVDNIAGKWQINYTTYPSMHNTVYASYISDKVKVSTIVATAKQVSEEIELKADPEDANRFIAKLSDYDIAFVLDPETTKISIPGYQKGLGEVTINEVKYELSRGVINFDPETFDEINGSSYGKIFMFADKNFLSSAPATEEVEDGVKLTYTFVPGVGAAAATGLSLLGENTTQSISMRILYGQFIDIYDHVSISRVFTKEAAE